jgi:DNA-directed RNA polymerase subunit RPC12/RpoP
VKYMQTNTEPIRPDEQEQRSEEGEDSFKCDECGGTFQKPLWATDSSKGNVEEYYACPRCMTKVDYRKAQPSTAKESEILVEEHEKASEKPKDDLVCNHFLGYMKKRAKDVPIPDECLTCSRMIECMLH